MRGQKRKNIKFCHLRDNKEAFWKNSAKFVFLSNFGVYAAEELALVAEKYTTKIAKLALYSTLNERNFSEQSQNVTGKNTSHFCQQ